MFGSVSICIVTNVKYVLVSQVLFLKCNNSNTTGRISVELWIICTFCLLCAQIMGSEI